MARPFTRLEDRRIERRASSRHRTLLAARLLVGEHGATLACCVRNLSDHGAQIELESLALLQPPAQLLLVRDGTIHEARLIWAWRKSVGLAFTASHSAQAPATPEILHLRTLWSTLRA